jgi:hypothetical protein
MAQFIGNPFEEKGFDPAIMDIAVTAFKRGRNGEGVYGNLTLYESAPAGIAEQFDTVPMDAHARSYLRRLASDTTDPDVISTIGFGIICIGSRHEQVGRHTLRFIFPKRFYDELDDFQDGLAV